MRYRIHTVVILLLLGTVISAAVAAQQPDDIVIYDKGPIGDWAIWGWGIDSLSYASGEPVRAAMIAPSSGIFFEIPDWEYHDGIQAQPEDVLSFEYREIAPTTSMEIRLIDRENRESQSIRLNRSGAFSIPIGDFTGGDSINFNAFVLIDTDNFSRRLSEFEIDHIRVIRDAVSTTGDSPEIVSFMLVDDVGDVRLREVVDGDTISLSETSKGRLALEAVVDGEAYNVRFDHTDPSGTVKTKYDRYLPYAFPHTSWEGNISGEALAIGQHTLRAQARVDDNGVRVPVHTKSITFTVVDGPIQSSTPATQCGKLEQEAEDGEIVGGFEVNGNHLVAIGNRNIPNRNNDDRVEYCVTAPAAGEYKLGAWIDSPSVNADSFYVQVNDDSVHTWHLDAQDFTLEYLSKTVKLDKGKNTFVIFSREPGTKIDRFIFEEVGSVSGTPEPDQTSPTPTPEVGSPSNDCSLEQEAEDGEIVGGFEAQGNYLVAVGGTNYETDGGKSNSHRVDYCVAASADGDYKFAAWIDAPSQDSNSYYLRVNNSNYTWELPVGDLSRKELPQIIRLKEGQNTLTIFRRESGIKMDKFEFEAVDDSGSKPEATPTPVAAVSTPVPTSRSCDLSQEAESGDLFGDFEVDGEYLRATGGNNYEMDRNDRVEYCVQLSAAGNYVLSGWFDAPDKRSDSIHLVVNGREYEWSVRGNDFDTREYLSDAEADDPINSGNRIVLPLRKGANELTLYKRESGLRVDRWVLERTNQAPAPTTPPQPEPTQQSSIDPAPAPSGPSEPIISASEADYRLRPGNINSQWPSNLRAGDIVFLDPGTYTGGDITLRANGTSDNQIIIRKTPGTSGKVIFDGGKRTHTLFNISGSYIQFGGTQIGSGWEPDMVVRDYQYTGLKFRKEANDIRIHHTHFLDNGTSNGFGIKINGQNIFVEYNKFEDNRADAIQVETGNGVNFRNVVIRYNYGLNRVNGDFAWNAGIHTDFVQVHRGPASNIQIYGNLIRNYTNPLLLGDSWGSPTNVTIRDNFIVFESNAISTNSRGNIEGNWVISNNTLVLYRRESGSGAAILLNNKDSDGRVDVSCNVFYGVRDSVVIDIDSSVDVTGGSNIRTGRVSSHSEINTSSADLGYSMTGADDLSGISVLRSPASGGGCTQGASFASVNEHLRVIDRTNRVLGEFHFAPLPIWQLHMPLFSNSSETLQSYEETPIRISSGSVEYIEEFDEESGYSFWLSDRYYVDGQTAVRDELDLEPKYQTERWGSRGYEIPIQNGEYLVRLHFVENYLDGPDQRIFSADVEGVRLENIDIFAEAGGKHVELVREIEAKVIDHSLSIQFLAEVEETSISGIEIFSINRESRQHDSNIPITDNRNNNQNLHATPIRTNVINVLRSPMVTDPEIDPSEAGQHP